MSTPTADDQARRIEYLEMSLRRWKRGTLAFVLLLLLAGGGLFVRERVRSGQAQMAAREMQMVAYDERQRADEERARVEANFQKAREAAE
jgi:hypothetical protein